MTVNRRTRSVWERLHRCFDLSDAPQLNWKGRAIERLLRARRLLPAVLAPLLLFLTNETCYVAYRVYGALRRSDRVRSVLQLSIISHKQFMVSRALRRHGLKADYFALNVGPAAGILDVGYDYSIAADVAPRKRRLLEIYYLWTVLARYDVIHSHFKTLLSADGWEFGYLKRLGKVVVFHYRGCDVRHRSLNMRLQPVLNCCQECDYPVGSCDTDYQRSQVAITRAYGDLFFVTTPDLRDFAAGSEHVPFIHPLGVDVESIAPVARDHGVFRVVTSSTHHGIDGTRFIRDAVERLRREGHAIELVEVSATRYLEALAIYKSADVYVGKLRMGYYNNANIETMMLGVPNMSYIRDEFRSIAPDCPIIVTTPDSVYDRLRYYVDHRDELREIGARGPAFVHKHHDPDRIALQMIARYNQVFAARRRPRHMTAEAAPVSPVPVTRDLTR
jgi:glycosyltransferase involved in cell wall biosynthesis